MKQALVIVVLVVASLGCGSPAFTSAMRASSLPPGVRAELVCDEAQRDDAEMTARAQARSAQGARLVYVSEYTSSNQVGVSVMMCFERGVQ